MHIGIVIEEDNALERPTCASSLNNPKVQDPGLENEPLRVEPLWAQGEPPGLQCKSQELQAECALSNQGCLHDPMVSLCGFRVALHCSQGEPPSATG